MKIHYSISFVYFVLVSRASDFGLMKIDDTGRVIAFSEKPKGDDLKAMVGHICLFIPPICPMYILESYSRWPNASVSAAHKENN